MNPSFKLSEPGIKGFALGGGAELAAACDMRIVQNDARIQFVQVQMGVVTGWQGKLG